VLKEDVQRHLDRQQAEPEEAQAKGTAKETEGREAAEERREAPGGERQEEAVPMSPLRRHIAKRLVEAQQTAALLTTFNEIDMTNVMALRGEFKDSFEAEYGTRLGFMSFFVKAAIDALKRLPQINAEIRDQSIVYKNYYDIGVAVSTKRGLIVPVIRNAEQLSFAEIEETIRDFGKRASENKLAPDELQGGTFTITNGGVFGSLMSTPIVNPPQSGVLGMHAIQERPVAIDGEVVIRPMMYVALTYDHRIVDGREAVTFLKRIKDTVENPARMLLEI
jgi:2-oxoglutarate dehydrogenase E2 component (dihydrolipoamide succinyltransferase)